MKRILFRLVLIGLVFLAAGLWLTRPRTVDAERFAAFEGDALRGEAVFWAGGCASCHKAEGSEDALELPGGRRFKTDFGTFIAPNISPDATHGLGAWSLTDFASAMLKGTSPDGAHYYPAFPYSTYTRARDQDIVDLWAFLQKLPLQDRADVPHELGFPFSIRASVGVWKFLFLGDEFVRPEGENARGRYLVEALGHCSECHTPRNLLGALDTSRWMAGAPNPSGKGRIPGLTPGQLEWSEADIAFYLKTGFTPDFDTASGEMVEVILNMAKLAPEDRVAIAAYIKALPAAN
jgi:mono/diheme cytochrome c family protein